MLPPRTRKKVNMDASGGSNAEPVQGNVKLPKPSSLSRILISAIAFKSSLPAVPGPRNYSCCHGALLCHLPIQHYFSRTKHAYPLVTLLSFPGQIFRCISPSANDIMVIITPEIPTCLEEPPNKNRKFQSFCP